MAVYRREIKKISEKLLQKIKHYMASDIKILNKNYRLTDLLILNQISASPAQRSIKEWGSVLDIGRNEMRDSIKRLVSSGDLKRMESERDSRVVLVGLTKRGQQVLDHFSDSEAALIDFVLKDLTVNDEKAVLKFLSKLNQLTVEKHHENNPLK